MQERSKALFHIFVCLLCAALLAAVATPTQVRLLTSKRPFSPALDRRRSALARQPLHCIYDNDA
jgi:hypothetical protein